MDGRGVRPGDVTAGFPTDVASALARFYEITDLAAQRIALSERPDPDAWQPYPHQIPPEGDWRVWGIMGGRGAGKTDAASAWINDHMVGPPCVRGLHPHRAIIAGPTLGDVIESSIEGPSGVKAHNPDVEVKTTRGRTFALWPNGSRARLLGGSSPADVARFRAAGNTCACVFEELAAIRYLLGVWEHADLGCRLGPKRQIVFATTPRVRPLVVRLDREAKLDDSGIVLARATMYDNPSLPDAWKAGIEKRYAGTRLGRQEVHGELLDDVVGALWNLGMIEEDRAVLDTGTISRLDEKGGVRPVKLLRVVVSVDPSWGTMGDEVGIVVVGAGSDGHAYVLADLSRRARPAEWGRLAGETYRDGVPGFVHRLDRVLGEKNRQGEQVRLVMETAAAELGITIPFTLVNSSVGKRMRAEPVVALYEQHRVHHVGVLPGLEDQMTTWVPPDSSEAESETASEVQLASQLDAERNAGNDEEQGSSWSPDRIDALVAGITWLLLDQSTIGAVELAQGRIPGVRGGIDPVATLPPHLRRATAGAMRRG